MESLIRVFVFLFVLVLTVSSTWAATANIFMLSDERAGLITNLVNAGYGEYSPRGVLVAISDACTE